MNLTEKRDLVRAYRLFNVVADRLDEEEIASDSIILALAEVLLRRSVENSGVKGSRKLVAMLSCSLDQLAERAALESAARYSNN